ncbi:MAG: ROK family protein [Verrucomicrobiaceae bacterium]|nr:MAG: ROK family protein [Verrucomicrobiaceae bacterium]
MSRLLWGIDLGGTKIEGVILDADQPQSALHRLRRETGAAQGYEHVLAQIVGVIRDLERVSGHSCPPVIGVGTPGALEPDTGALKNSNTTCLNGRPLLEDIQAALGSEVCTMNDANCFALAEALLGAGAGEEVVLGLILGTGVGGGIVVRGKIINGKHGIAGEWGHNPIAGESRRCYCGRIGCVETVLAGPSLERDYREAGGDSVRLPEIASRARDGEPLAAAVIRRLQEKFGEAIAAVINIVDPDAIVIGGGVGNVDELYTGETRACIQRHVFTHEFQTRILRPQLGDSAGVFGAALLGDCP